MKAKKHLNLRIPLWWPGGPGWRRLARWLLPSPGNVLFTLLVVGGLLWAGNAGALPLRAPMLAGDSTTTISYQGRLANSNGDPVDSAGIGMQFCLYDTDVGGSPVDDWCENHTSVPVEDGLFHVLLGNIKPIPVSMLASHSTLWLGITVDGDSEMTPREQIASVPYAMIASTVANGAITTTKIADEAVTQAKVGAESVTTEKLVDGAVTSRKASLTYGQIGIPKTSTSSDSWTDIPNSTLVLNTDVPSVLEVTADLLLHTDNPDTAAQYAINVNGGRWTNRFWQAGDTGWYSSVAHYIYLVDPGPVTIKLQWQRAYGSGAIALNNVGGQSYLSAKLWSQ